MPPRRPAAAACALALALAAPPLLVRAAPPPPTSAAVEGAVIDAQTALPLAAARIDAGSAHATTGRDGTFRLELPPGVVRLQVALSAYAPAQSDELVLAPGTVTRVTLALRRAAASGATVIGRTATSASAALRAASASTRVLDAEALLRGGELRAADALRRLPGVNNALTGDTAAPSDDVNLTLRGIGTLETATTFDGHPLAPGFPGGYNAQLTPLVGLRDVVVTYGSGSDLAGADAIAGSVDLRTLEPTAETRMTLGQTVGAYDRRGSRVQATGTSGRLGVALAAGVQTTDGALRGTFYESGAAFDPSATDPAARAAATYPVDARATSREGLAKLRWSFSPRLRLTATIYDARLWEDKTGNGDGDGLGPAPALAFGNAQLAAKVPGDPCPAGSFSVQNATVPGVFWGTGFDGRPDGGARCQTPASYAAAARGLSGAGPAWQADGLIDGALRLEAGGERHAFSAVVASNRYVVHTDRTDQLPWATAPLDTGFDRIAAETTTSYALADDLALGASHTLGLRLAGDTRAFAIRQSGVLVGAPIVTDAALTLRDAYRAPGSPLTLTADLTARRSSATNAGTIDPRVAAVWRRGNDVVRVAAGATTTQPAGDQLGLAFVPTPLGGAGGGAPITCGGLNAIGSAPSSALRPERGVDEEVGWSRRFGDGSTAQLSLYDVRVRDKLAGTVVPLAAVGTAFVDPATLAAARQAVAAACGAQSVPDALLGVGGTLNVAALRARGLTLDGRLRLGRRAFLDYDWAVTSTALVDAPATLLAADPTQILGAQLPRLPLHTLDLAADVTTGAVEARLERDWTSAGNTKALPAYALWRLRLGAALGRGTLTAGVENLFNAYADPYGRRYEGVPLALSALAPPGAAAPYTGIAATERFGLPPRALTLDYVVRVR